MSCEDDSAFSRMDQIDGKRSGVDFTSPLLPFRSRVGNTIRFVKMGPKANIHFRWWGILQIFGKHLIYLPDECCSVENDQQACFHYKTVNFSLIRGLPFSTYAKFLGF